MAVNVNLQSIGSGFNRSTINNNFEAIKEALEDGVSRSGYSPNMMETDLDLNSNDLLNVGRIETDKLIVDGDEFVPSSVTAKGEKGDAATIELGTVSTGHPGTDVIITNSGTENDAVFNFTIPRGDTGASGPGSGDMVSTQNLNDVDDKPTAFDNIKQQATDSYTGVVELATNAETIAGTDTTHATTPANVKAAIDDRNFGVVRLGAGSIPNGATWTYNFNSYFGQGYRHYELIIDNITSSQPNSQLMVQFGQDTSDLDVSNYCDIWTSAIGTGTGSSGGSGPSSGNSVYLGATSSRGCNVKMMIYNPLDSSARTFVGGDMLGFYGNTDSAIYSRFAGFRRSGRMTGIIRFQWTSGQIVSGATYRFYGYR